MQLATTQPVKRGPGGSQVGRLMRRSRTGAAGIRFEWLAKSGRHPTLRVIATWTDKLGRPHHTSYSVEVHGFDGALDKAIAARVSAGAPMPDRAALLQRLVAEYDSRGSTQD